MIARNVVRPAVLFLLGLLIVIAALTLLGYVGHAYAAAGGVGDDVPGNPVSLITQLYEFMRTGRGTAATGVVLMLIVWLLRSGLLGRWIPWFKTMVGGYVLNFGTAFLTYGGVALLADQPITIGLVGNAIGSGFTGAGGWEALRDLFNKIGKPASTLTALLIAAVLIVAPSCAGAKGEARQIVDDVVDCTKGDLSFIPGLIPTLLPLIGGNSPDWKIVGAQLETAGARIGTCVMGELINRWELGSATRKAMITVDGRAELRELKAKFGVRIVRTSAGEL